MPQKNWLIRTKSNQILGPVSKEKVIELYHNGSVRPEDEICSGNGFWFFLREKDQVEYYLLGNKKQPFNPLGEGLSVLTASPDELDPPVAKSDDITLVGGINLAALKQESDPKPAVAPVSALATPAPGTVQVKPPVAKPREAVAPKVTPTPVAPGKIKKKPTSISPGAGAASLAIPRKRWVSDKIVMIGTIVVLIALAVVLYYRKRILREFIQGGVSVSLISQAHAQENPPVSKKKASFHP
jgi:hypothetical protein